MANENDGLYISASLDIPVTEQNIKTNDIPKINSDLASDQNAKIKLNAEVDYNKVKSNVQNQLNSMASKLKLNVDSVNIDTNKVVEPLRKGFKQLFTEISNTKLVDTNVMTKNVKEMFGVNNTKEIKQAYDDLKQTLALNPNDMKAIMQSYTTLSSTILDGVSLDKEFDTSYLGLNKIYNKIFECATAFKEVTNSAKNTGKQIVNTSEQSAKQIDKLKIKTDELKSQFNTPLKSVNGITTQFDTTSLDVVKEAKQSFEDLFAGTSSKFSTNINSTIDDNGIKKVQNFTIQVKSAIGEVEKFKYALTNIGSQTQPDFKYVLQNINEADAGVLRLQESQAKFDSKVQGTIKSLKTQLEILKSSSNANNGGSSAFNAKYEETLATIKKLNTSDSLNFDKYRADAQASIKQLSNLMSEEAKTQSHYYTKIFDEIKQINQLKRKLVTSGSEESQEINHQISLLSKRIGYDEKQLEKKKLVTNELEKQKNELIDIGNKQLELTNARQKDKKIASQNRLSDRANAESIKLMQDLNKQQNRYTDTGSNYYVDPSNTEIINQLNAQFDVAEKSIKALKSATSDTFNTMKAEADANVKKLQQLIDNFKNADKIATSLRAKDFKTVKTDEINNIERFVAQIKNLSGAEPILKLIGNDIANVKAQLSGATNKNELLTALNSFSNLESKTNIYKEIFKGFGKSDWFSSKRNQIDELDNVSAKAKIYQAELQRISKEWEQQGLLVDNVKSKAGQISKVMGNIKNPETFDKYASEFDKLITITKQVKTNLDEQVTTYQKIYDLETKIARLNSNPERNATSIAHYSTQLAEQNKRLANLQMQSNAYKNVISLEEQERIVLSAVTKEQEKLNIAKAKATDTSRNKLEKETVSIEKYRQKIEKLITTLELLKQANSKAMSGKFDYKLQADSLIAQLQSLLNQENISFKEIKTGFDNANASTTKLRNNLQVTGNTGASVFDTLKDKAVKFASWMGLTTIISAAARQFRNLYENVVAIDTAMVDLKKVTEGTDSQFNAFLTNAIQNAKTLGADVTDIINSTANFSRLGYSLPDATELGRVATLYQNIGDGITSDQASESIISTMKAFGYEADRAEEIIDKFNEVGNNYAISSAGLGEALQRSASALAGANNDLSQSIALQVGANDVIQDPDVVGKLCAQQYSNVLQERSYIG